MIQNCRIIARTLAHSKIFSTSYNYQLTRTFKKNIISQAKIIENVPVLGESITEGSIASWSKNIGDSVAVDDVIVIIETDKVTVDIKSTLDGILTAYLADDTVIVGAPLYEIETDAQAGVGKITTADKVPQVSTVAVDQVPPVLMVENHAGTGNSHARVPSIKFLGKRSHIKPVHLKEAESPVLQKNMTIPVIMPKAIKEGNGVDFATLKDGAMFGRPSFSQKEIDAIESGFYMEA